MAPIELNTRIRRASWGGVVVLGAALGMGPVLSPNFLDEAARVRHELPVVTFDLPSRTPAGAATSFTPSDDGPEAGATLGLRLAETVTDPDDTRDAVADEAGLWVATGGGLLRVPFDDALPTRWWTTADGLPDHRLTAIEAVPGGLAVGTEAGGVLMLDVTTGEPSVVASASVGDARVSDLLYADDALFVATWGEGIWMSDGSTEALTFRPVGPKTGMQSRRVTSVAWLDGELLAGTAGAGLWVRGTNGKARRFVARGGLAGDFVVDLVRRDDAVWIAAPGGVSRYRRGVLQTWLPGDRTPAGMTRALGADGSLALSGGRVGRFGSTDTSALPPNPDGLGPWNGVPVPEVRWIVDGGGRRWAGTDRGLVVERDGGWMWVIHEGPGSNDITTAAVHRGSLLVGTFDRGAWRDGRALPLSNAEVNDALIDDDGVAWIATSGGLARATGDAIPDVRLFGRVHGLTNLHVGAVTRSGDALWVGTAAGVQRFEGGSFGAPADDRVAHVYDLAPEGEHVVAGTLEGLWSVRPSGATPFRYETGELPDNWVNGVAVAPDGRLWAGTYDAGLAVRDGSGGWTWLLEGDSVSNGWVNPGALLALPDNTVLVGTMGGGLLRVGVGGEIERWTMADGLAGDDVTAIAVEGDVVWVGTRSGLSRLEMSRDRAS